MVSRSLSPLEAVSTARTEWLGGNDEGADGLIDQLTRMMPDFLPLRLLEAERAIAGHDFEVAGAILTSVADQEPSDPGLKGLLADFVAQVDWLKAGSQSRPFGAQIVKDPAKFMAQLRSRVSREGPYGVGMVLLDHALIRHQAELTVQDRAATFAALGLGHYRARRLEKAISAFVAQIACDPNRGDAHFNLGTALSEKGDTAGAEVSYRAALMRMPDLASAHHNLGNLLWTDGRIDEAGEHFARTVDLNPNHAEAGLNLGFYRLLSGDYDAGWPLFERRFETKRLNAPAELRTDWDGEAASVVVLEAEQGLGDTLQFARFIDAVLARAGTVYLRVQAPLVALLSCKEEPRLIVEDRDEPTAAPETAKRAGLMSLAWLLKVSAEHFAESLPLKLPTLGSNWLDARGEGLNVGLVWAGNPDHMGDAQRSIDFELMASLLDVEGVRFHSLQVGERALKEPVSELHDLGGRLIDFRETAGVLQAMDLVISVDTAVAHLAGSLARPTWLLIPTVPDWRWGRSAETTPWYPSLRLFRQTQTGDWAGVIERVRAELAELA